MRGEEEEEEQSKVGIRSFCSATSVRSSNMGRGAGGKQGWKQSTGRRERERDLPAHFTWTSVRPDSYRVTVRERERDSETDTYRQARPQDRKAGKESERVIGHANNYPRKLTDR